MFPVTHGQYLRYAKPGALGHRECDVDASNPPCGAGIPYLSHQNDNLRDELPSLAGDVPPALDFVKKVTLEELARCCVGGLVTQCFHHTTRRRFKTTLTL